MSRRSSARAAFRSGSEKEIGATPVLYGDGLVERVRAVAPDGVDAVFDVAGQSPLADLISLVPQESQVVTIAQFDLGGTAVQLTTGRSPKAAQALAEAATLLQGNQLVIKVQTFPLDRAAEAHEISQHGHVRGKLILVP